MTQLEKTRTFRKWLTQGETFVVPEVWDVASARILADAGFRCVGTSARAIGWSCGLAPEEQADDEEMLLVAARVARALALPVMADLDCGLASPSAPVEKSVETAIAAGCVAVVIGDGVRNGAHCTIERQEMVKRVRAARKACAAAGMRSVVIARTEAMMSGPSGHSPFEEAVERGEAYFDAGADCVLVPGVQHLQVVERLVGVVGGPLAISVAMPPAPELKAYAQAGVACITLGSGLMRAALGALRHRAEELMAFGAFNHLERAIPSEEFEALMEAPGEAAQSSSVME